MNLVHSKHSRQTVAATPRRMKVGEGAQFFFVINLNAI